MPNRFRRARLGHEKVARICHIVRESEHVWVQRAVTPDDPRFWIRYQGILNLVPSNTIPHDRLRVIADGGQPKALQRELFSRLHLSVWAGSSQDGTLPRDTHST